MMCWICYQSGWKDERLLMKIFDLKKSSDITTILSRHKRKKAFGLRTKVTAKSGLLGIRLRLNQVLMNLLSNAVKFTQKDGLVTLLIRQMESG